MLHVLHQSGGLGIQGCGHLFLRGREELWHAPRDLTTKWLEPAGAVQDARV